MWARTSLSKAGTFTGLFAYSASHYICVLPMTSEASMSASYDSWTGTDHKQKGRVTDHVDSPAECHPPDL